MSDGVQITIPDFDDDGPSTPFGRGAFGGPFGGGGGAFGNPAFGGSSTGLDSPGITFNADRSYFSHSRGDSYASVDSDGSGTARYASKPATPFTHSARPSIATGGGGFTKKPSFASIRNAFKSSGKSSNNDPPPMPSLDPSPYPVLKNPFNRSTSSLSHAAGPKSSTPHDGPYPPSSFPRPPTPGSSTLARVRHPTTPKSKSHIHSKSSASILPSWANDYASANNDPFGYGQPFGYGSTPSLPPPVPRMPAAFGNIYHNNGNNAYRYDSSPTPDFEDDKVVMDPKTPAEYALHAVFIRFATCAEAKIDAFLRHPLDPEPLLTKFVGEGVDAKLDESLESLGIIAQKHAKKVVASIIRWRKTQIETVSPDILHAHLDAATPNLHLSRSQTQPSSSQPFRSTTALSTTSGMDIASLLDERKSLASIHVMCRALIAVLQRLSKDGGDAIGPSLEESTFEQFRKPDRKLLSQSVNHRINSELYATLLGHLSNVRFASVADCFLRELRPMGQGQVSKDLGTKYENIVKGLKYIKIKVWPPEAFEDGAEFMEELSRCYANAHGFGLKVVFSQTLVHLLHPIVKTAQAETNHPQWSMAIEKNIYPKAKEMMSKPRYWIHAFPLVISSLCAAPQSYFILNWQACFDTAASKLKDKEKQLRIVIMNGLMRLIWTYLFRCQESASTTTTKLESCLRVFFPPSKSFSSSLTSSSSSPFSSSGVFPPDEHLEILICIIHFILARHPEFGREACLELLQETSVSKATSGTGNLATLLSPERTSIVINALLLSLHTYDSPSSSSSSTPSSHPNAPQPQSTPSSTPPWPSSDDFSLIPLKQDYPSSAAFPTPGLLHAISLKPSLRDFWERCAGVLTTVGVYCFGVVGRMCVFDEQWSVARFGGGAGMGSGYGPGGGMGGGGIGMDESSGFVFRVHHGYQHSSTSGLGGSGGGSGPGYGSSGHSANGSIDGYAAGAGVGGVSIPVAYPAQYLPHVSILQTTFAAWPRCLYSGSLAGAGSQQASGVGLGGGGVGTGTSAVPVPITDAIEMLLWGVIHVDPGVADAASLALRRFMEDDPSHAQQPPSTTNSGVVGMGPGGNALLVVSAFTSFLFSPSRICQDHQFRLQVEYSPLLALWFDIVDDWVAKVKTISSGSISPTMIHQIVSTGLEVESAALILLSHVKVSLYSVGVKVVRLLGGLNAHLGGSSTSTTPPPDAPVFLPTTVRLNYRKSQDRYLTGFDDLLDKSEQSRLDQWRKFPGDEVYMRIADSVNEKDRKLWRYVYPAILQDSMGWFKSGGMMNGSSNINGGATSPTSPTSSSSHPMMTPLFRDGIMIAVSKYHPCISYIAGLSNRVPPGMAPKPQGANASEGYRLLAENKALIDQWHVWVKILCSTASPPDNPQKFKQVGGDRSDHPHYPHHHNPHLRDNHSRAGSDISFEKERLSTTRGLFRYLTPFLDSEYTFFRDAAVLCISSFPANAYPSLLEDLSLLAGRQFYDDPRSKMVTTPMPDQGFNMAGGGGGGVGGMGGGGGVGERGRSGSATLISERSKRQERLHSAVARIYSITAHLVFDNQSSQRNGTSGGGASVRNQATSLSNILKFIRHTQGFLSSPENRDNPSLQRLRRYFCGTVEKLFYGIANLADSDRFIPHHMHLTLYRLCEEWCQLGPQSEAAKKRQAVMQRLVEENVGNGIGPAEARENAQKFRHETASLSQASVGALTALCYKAFFPPDLAANSPTERPAPEFFRQLAVAPVLERLSAIMTSSHPANPAKGKATLKSLLTHREFNYELAQESLRNAIMIGEKVDSHHQRFFEVIADIVMHEDHGFSFSQIVCLGLTNLRHPSPNIRALAFGILEATHQQDSGILPMTTYEPTVASLASTTYIHAHRLISEFLAGEHPYEATNILSQLGNWLPQLPPEAYDTNVILLLLQMLESWIPNINLMTDDKTAVSREGLSCLYHLTSMTLRYGQSHAEQVLVIWTKLVDTPHQSNGHAAVRFLMEQAHKVGNTSFIICAANIVSSLCQTHIGRAVFEELCSVILPSHMLPTIDHKLSFPEAQDMKLWEDLDALFSDQPRLSLGTAQFAWLFLSDAALQRYWELKEHLPILLHSILIHLDHRHSFVRQRAHSMLFQVLRSWVPGYVELTDRSTVRTRSALKGSLNAFEKEAVDSYWTEDESSETAVPKMTALCERILGYLEPLAPFLVSQWGSLALHWGTQCSIRGIAFRSLQIFRALMPRVKKPDFAMLLGRLSNIIASADENIQSFTSEIFATLNAVAASNDLGKTILPQIFWTTCACLSTTVESEFGETLKLLDCILSKIDLDEQPTVEQLISQRPADWHQSPYLQPLLLKGLRSSVTYDQTMKILQKLTKIQDGQLIDPSDGRLRDLYTVSLPWCLYAMDNPNQAAPIKAFAEDIAALAGREEKRGIQKIMISFSKSHFRTRDDFLRQSVSSLRENYAAQHWGEMVTLLLGLVLNKEQWLRIHAMQVLKVLLTHRQTRNPMELLGSELLMPLLRLLETDLAAQALDVLEEPMLMSTGGPAAKHVLRMSLHFGSLPNHSTSSDSDAAVTVFGAPEESGWSIAQADKVREACRANVVAVFDTCSVPNRPSRIEFEPEVEGLASIKTPLADDLGGLVRNLHEITSFFDPNPSRNNNAAQPTRRLEARVAAILAKSTAIDVADTPQTPYLDVFRVSGIADSQDSDEYSDSDSDTDAFMFDSLATPIRSTSNINHINGSRPTH